MLKFLKAASFAALFATIGSAILAADPSFASLNATENPALTADMITVDEQILTQDAEALAIANREDMTPILGKQGEVVFTGGTGDFVQPFPEPEAESDTLPQFPNNAASLRDLVQAQDPQAQLDKQAECLAGAIYFESKGESLEGQLAVARVIMARVKSPRFPNSICGVVFEKSQFSFVRGGKMPRIDRSHGHWRNAKAIAQIALADAWKSPMEGALFFHAKYVNPKWRLTRLGSVGLHVFYR
jgi:Cell Wall Hydrolase